MPESAFTRENLGLLTTYVYVNPRRLPAEDATYRPDAVIKLAVLGQTYLENAPIRREWSAPADDTLWPEAMGDLLRGDAVRLLRDGRYNRGALAAAYDGIVGDDSVLAAIDRANPLAGASTTIGIIREAAGDGMARELRFGRASRFLAQLSPEEPTAREQVHQVLAEQGYSLVDQRWAAKARPRGFLAMYAEDYHKNYLGGAQGQGLLLIDHLANWPYVATRDVLREREALQRLVEIVGPLTEGEAEQRFSAVEQRADVQRFRNGAPSQSSPMYFVTETTASQLAMVARVETATNFRGRVLHLDEAAWQQTTDTGTHYQEMLWLAAIAGGPDKFSEAQRDLMDRARMSVPDLSSAQDLTVAKVIAEDWAYARRVKLHQRGEEYVTVRCHDGCTQQGVMLTMEPRPHEEGPPMQVRTGNWIGLDPDRRVRESSFWKRGVRYGEARRYDESGRLRERRDFYEGQLEGYVLTLDPNGRVTQRTRYVDGAPVDIAFYKPSEAYVFVRVPAPPVPDEEQRRNVQREYSMRRTGRPNERTKPKPPMIDGQEEILGPLESERRRGPRGVPPEVSAAHRPVQAPTPAPTPAADPAPAPAAAAPPPPPPLHQVDPDIARRDALRATLHRILTEADPDSGVPSALSPKLRESLFKAGLTMKRNEASQLVVVDRGGRATPLRELIPDAARADRLEKSLSGLVPNPNPRGRPNRDHDRER